MKTRAPPAPASSLHHQVKDNPQRPGPWSTYRSPAVRRPRRAAKGQRWRTTCPEHRRVQSANWSACDAFLVPKVNNPKKNWGSMSAMKKEKRMVQQSTKHVLFCHSSNARQPVLLQSLTENIYGSVLEDHEDHDDHGHCGISLIDFIDFGACTRPTNRTCQQYKTIALRNWSFTIPNSPQPGELGGS